MSKTKKNKGYMVIEGKGKYAHSFGGNLIKTLSCPNCGTSAHLILTFDLKDPAFDIIEARFPFLPLVSCLNCSGNWDTQYYKVNEGYISDLHQKDEEKWVMDEEERLNSPLPMFSVNLLPLKSREVLKEVTTDEERDIVFDNLGMKYIARVFGGSLRDSDEVVPVNCPVCKKEMNYIASIAEDATEGKLIKALPFLFGELILNFFFCNHCHIVRVEPLHS